MPQCDMHHIQQIKKRKGMSARGSESPLQLVQDCIEVRFKYARYYYMNTSSLQRIDGSRTFTRLPEHVVLLAGR